MQNFRLSEEYQLEANRKFKEHPLVLADLFAPFPDQFGLRGDPYLWGMMSAYFCYSWLDNDNGRSFEKVFKEAFYELTGQAWDDAPQEFPVESLDKGGMSGGWISMSWWRETALPLLQSRYDAANEIINAI